VRPDWDTEIQELMRRAPGTHAAGAGHLTGQRRLAAMALRLPSPMLARSVGCSVKRHELLRESSRRPRGFRGEGSAVAP
jgi:hypothetical protein